MSKFGEFQGSFFVLELDVWRVPVRKQNVGTRNKSTSGTNTGSVTRDGIILNLVPMSINFLVVDCQ